MARRSPRTLLQETLQRVNVPSFIADADGVIRWMNDVATAAFGKLDGLPYTEFVAPEYVPVVEVQLAKKRRGELHTAYEIEVILRDGVRRRVEVSSVPIEGDASCHGIFGVVLPSGSRLTPVTASGLTPRQGEVLGLLAQGHSTGQIASMLHLSRETVRNHIRHLLRALGAHSRIEAISEARRRGFV